MENFFRVCLNVRVVSLTARRVVCAALVILGGWAQGARAGIITIDDFSEPHGFFFLGSGLNPTMEITHSSSGAIGSQRDTLISVVGQGMQNSATGFVGNDAADEINGLWVGTIGHAPTVATLQYSGINPLNTSTSLVNAHALGGGLGLDLTNGGANDRFLIHFLSNDAQPTIGLSVAITITSPGGKSSTETVHAQNSVPAAFDLFVPFSGLVGNASSSHADSITFVFNGADKSPNVDYEVQRICSIPRIPVPEPASGILLVTGLGTLGLAACAARRRRRQNLQYPNGPGPSMRS
jgi:hypothetical protein